MKLARKNVLILFISCYTLGNAYSQELTEEKAFSFEASYIGDAVSNLKGGIETGSTYLGMANLMLSLNTEGAGLWKGGEFFVNGMNTHGGEPSAELIGDFQTVSNIEAGDLTLLYELWYSQTIKKFTFIIGLQDLNAEYAASEYGGLYINSSFGIHSTIADNTPSPIFPFTRPGITLKFGITDNLNIQAAVYDGLLHEEDENKYNLNWDLKSTNGSLYISEIQSSYNLIKGLSSSYKFGVCYHNRHIITTNEGIPSETNVNYGFYLNADQQLIKNAGRAGGLGVFAQVGLSSSSVNNNSGYFGFGVNYIGISDKRIDDEFGIALAHSKFETNREGYETAIELTYKLVLNNNLFIQPDLQYIINPSGTNEMLENATVGIIRFGLNF